jgi:hypothetical protein
MNGEPGRYSIANSDKFVTDYDDTVEYFDVLSDKISTLYSEVHWRMHGDIKLPDEITRRFSNKVMAIVGYEVDQVEEGSGKSVPISKLSAGNSRLEMH